MSRKLLTSAVAVLLMTPLILPAAASAQASGAYIDGAEPWTESDCAADIPIVVGADAKAQSDIYSAVTLAGAIGTDCVILAGPRDGDMAAAQRARLEAAADGGYVVGGTAAVPEAKIGGRGGMTRLGGSTRWATAQQVGSEAAALAAGAEPETATAPGTALAAPADVTAPGLYLDGAEPWTASDCAGDAPIVVGGDAKAQSDIYSAVTLAGAIGTDCVILAGPRDGAMPASQRARLEAAEPGGYVLGGIAAVPTAKLAGRDMTRLGGVTRWATAELVGRRASGDTTAGSNTATETDNNDDTAATNSPQFTAVSADWWHSCGLRPDGTVTCWGWNEHGQADAPSGSFTAVSAGGLHSCGLRPDGTVTCWGWNEYGQPRAPSGSFTAVSSGSNHSCGLRSDATVTCWGYNEDGQADAPSGSFTAVSAGDRHSCGLRPDGTVTCWGEASFGAG
ncbi:RCC1 domain-containing protein [Candidatus Poriferisodalis sp.]|uniref:RCC1 domain-containing protein n=1 Tax=Candidatus Poriferisodalis sp. TaxID=3101277 RepID=UPI003B02DEC6